MVRRRKSLHWYLVGGEILTSEEWKLRSIDQASVDLENLSPLKRTLLSESILENDCKIGAPVALEGTKTAIRTVVSGEIDIITGKYLGRCLMSETENSFNIICDDPEVFSLIPGDKERQDMINTMKENVEKSAVMWDLAGAMFQLFSYFAYKVKIKKEVVVAAGRRVRQIKSGGGKGIDARYKTVSAIDIVDSDSPIVRPVVAPHFKTETSGHWRRLAHGSIGKGPDGSPEPGRTWVKRESKWRESANAPRTIYVKSTVKAAELKAVEYEIAAEDFQETINSDDPISNYGYGELYVLRCTVMKEEIYKVGWTSETADKRAEQLSSATGVPLAFVVVKSWKHENAEALEKSVHAMLDPYRINDRREFFRTNYRSIESIIEAEIQRTDRPFLGQSKPTP